MAAVLAGCPWVAAQLVGSSLHAHERKLTVSHNCTGALRQSPSCRSPVAAPQRWDPRTGTGISCLPPRRTTSHAQWPPTQVPACCPFFTHVTGRSEHIMSVSGCDSLLPEQHAGSCHEPTCEAASCLSVKAPSAARAVWRQLPGADGQVSCIPVLQLCTATPSPQTLYFVPLCNHTACNVLPSEGHPLCVCDACKA